MEIVRVRFVTEDNIGGELAPASILKFFSDISCKENGQLLPRALFRFEEIHVNLADFQEAEYLIYEHGKEIF